MKVLEDMPRKPIIIQDNYIKKMTKQSKLENLQMRQCEELVKHVTERNEEIKLARQWQILCTYLKQRCKYG